MNTGRSQELIVGCLAASTAVAAGSMLASDQTPGIRLVMGAAFAGVGLGTLSMFAPDLAGAFATLILTTSVFVYGGPLFDLVSERTAGDTAVKGSRARKPPTDPNGSVLA